MNLPRHILKFGLVAATVITPVFASQANGGASAQQLDTDCVGAAEQTDAQHDSAPQIHGAASDARQTKASFNESERAATRKQAAVVSEEGNK